VHAERPIPGKGSTAFPYRFCQFLLNYPPFRQTPGFGKARHQPDGRIEVSRQQA